MNLNLSLHLFLSLFLSLSVSLSLSLSLSPAVSLEVTSHPTGFHCHQAAPLSRVPAPGGGLFVRMAVPAGPPAPDVCGSQLPSLPLHPQSAPSILRVCLLHFFLFSALPLNIPAVSVFSRNQVAWGSSVPHGAQLIKRPANCPKGVS